MAITVGFEDVVATVDGESRGDDLWIGAPELRRALGWELKPEGLCRGPLCIPVPPACRVNGRINLAALARHRGQAVVHDAEGTIWVCGPAREGTRALVAPDFTLPDLDGRPHTLSAFRGKKVLLDSWASW